MVSVILFWLAVAIFLLDFVLYWLMAAPPPGARPYPRLTALGLAFLAAGLALQGH